MKKYFGENGKVELGGCPSDLAFNKKKLRKLELYVMFCSIVFGWKLNSLLVISMVQVKHLPFLKLKHASKSLFVLL